MRNWKIYAYLLIVLSLSGVGYVHAEDTATAQPAAKTGPCTADVEKHCASVERGQGRILKCLKEHDAELTTECKAHMQSQKARHEALKNACAADKDKFCKDVQPGQGGIGKCMREHENELSAACREQMAKRPARKS